MAYKFQIGDAIMSGALEQANGITVDEGGLTVTAGGVAVTAGGISVTAGALALNSQGITSAGSIAGATTISAGGGGFGVDADGDTDVKSLSVADGGTIGPDTVGDLITLSADGDITIKDGAYDFDIASHDGSNGLQLAGELVTSTAAELNLLDTAAAGTVVNSKAVIYSAGGVVQGTDFKGPDGFDIGNTTVADFMKFNAAEIIVKDGALDFDVASHDGTNGLKLGGSIVTATAENINRLTGLTPGTAAASKALVLDASRDLGAGDVNSINNLFLDGNLNADGTLDVDGTATFNGAMKMGNAAGDIIGITGSIGSTVLPDIASAWNLGSSAKPWKAIYVDSIIGGSVAWDVVICDGNDSISASAELAVVREGNVTVGLPAAEAGRNVRVKLSSSVGYVTVAPQSGEVIEGSAASVLLESTGSAVTFACMQGGGWVIL